MLQKKDHDFLNYLNVKTLPLKDNKIEQLLYFEKKYLKNSFDIIYSSDNSNEMIRWKKATLEFIRQNGNPKLINQERKIIYCALVSRESEDTKKMIKNIFYHFKDSIIILSNNNPLYKKLIPFFNKKGKIVVLFTNNNDDFNLDFSNLMILKSENPDCEMLDYADNIVLNYDEISNNFAFSWHKNKVIYI